MTLIIIAAVLLAYSAILFVALGLCVSAAHGDRALSARRRRSARASSGTQLRFIA